MSTEKILAERGEQYGDWQCMARVAQDLKRLAINPSMTPTQKESMEMICTKIARLATGNPFHLDSWRDISGYAELEVKTLESGADRQTANPMENERHRY